MTEIYPATKAVIEKDGKILILKRSCNEDCFKEEWDIPGGGIKFGEEPEESLKREVFEEAGIKIDILKPLRVWTFFKNSGQTQVVGVTFFCKYKSGEIKISKEHTDFKWINPEEIENYNIHEGIKKDVKTAFEF